MRQIIGFTGRIGSGKTTAAHELYNIGFMRVRFAGPLKAMAKVLLTDKQVDGSEKETPADVLGGMTPRRFMQLLGTEFGREMIWTALWTSAFERNCNHYPKQSIVCDDVRYANEVDCIKTLGGKVILIDRPNNPNPAQSHSSEKFDFPIDGSITNEEGQMEKFLRQVRELKQ